MALRNFSSVAVATTITGGITSSGTVITVASLAGYPSAPFISRLDADTVNEELVLVTNVAGTTLTVTRGYDSTAAVAHDSGATFAHCAAGIDFREANTHVNATAAVHGVSGTVVGTTDSQTLTNKTLTAPVITTISNGGTVSIPAGTDTLVGLAASQILTNKTLTSPTVNTPVLTLSSTTSTASGRLAVTPASGQLNLGDGTTALTITADTKAATLTNKTLTSPTINGATLSGTLAGGTFTGSTITTPTLTLSTSTSTTSGRLAVTPGSGRLNVGDGSAVLSFTADDKSATLTNKTLASPFLSGAVTGDATSGFGPWVAGSAAIGGAGWALGNGTATLNYATIGNTTKWRLIFTVGSTTTAGGSGLTFTLTGPPTPTAACYGISSVLDTSASAHYSGTCRIATSLVLTPRFMPTTLGGSDSVATTSNPITWATGDVLTCQGEYENV